MFMLNKEQSFINPSNISRICKEENEDKTKFYLRFYFIQETASTGGGLISTCLSYKSVADRETEMNLYIEMMTPYKPAKPGTVSY